MKTTQIFTYVFAVFLINNICTAQEKFTSESSEKSNCNIQNTTIEETIDGDNHKTLLAAVQATDIERLLDENIPFTIFAPSDHAFSKFSQSKLKEMLNSDDKNELETLLKYHIVAGKYTASTILRELCKGSGTTNFTTIQGNEITATMSGIDIILTDGMGNSAKITVADTTTTTGNSIMHEIDSVILPTRI